MGRGRVDVSGSEREEGKERGGGQFMFQREAGGEGEGRREN